MLLRELNVTNIGPFRGEQVVKFATDPNQPVTLIGGKNGCGKTTLLESILLVLYGTRARNLVGFSNYFEFLQDLTHRNCTEASISLAFDRREGGANKRYTISRAWEVAAESASNEKLVVMVDDELRPDLASSWPEFVEQILPVSMASLFFFDGERVTALADATTSTEALRASLYGLLGLDLVDRLQSDLVEFRQDTLKKGRQNGEPEPVASELDSAEVALQEARLRVDAAELELSNEQTAERATDTELVAARELFSKSGGELFDQREQFVADLASVESRRELATASALRLAASALPLQIVKPLLGRVAEVGGQIQRADEADLLLRSHKERDERLLLLLDQTKTFTDDHIGALERAFTADRQRYEQTYLAPFHVSPDMHKTAQDLSAIGGDQLQKEVVATLSAIESAEQDAHDCRGALASVPDEKEISALVRDLAKAESNSLVANTAVQQASAELREAQKQLDARHREFEKYATAVLESGAASSRTIRIDREVKKAQTVLKSFQTRIVAKNLGHIRRNVLEALSALYRKNRLIADLEIDPDTLTIRLLQASGETLQPDRLSAGERQLLATALLWGLSKSTERRLPTIVDTPIARLDSSHRTNLVERYFPAVSEQVVLLSTDEELVGDYYTKLTPAVGQTYLLEYDDAENCTKVKAGYFS